MPGFTLSANADVEPTFAALDHSPAHPARLRGRARLDADARRVLPVRSRQCAAAGLPAAEGPSGAPWRARVGAAEPDRRTHRRGGRHRECVPRRDPATAGRGAVDRGRAGPPGAAAGQRATRADRGAVRSGAGPGASTAARRPRARLDRRAAGARRRGVPRGIRPTLHPTSWACPPCSTCCSGGWRSPKDLLRTERLSTAQVACRVGYQSASAFTTAFTRLAGCSPTEFARRPGLSSGSQRQDVPLAGRDAAVQQRRIDRVDGRRALGHLRIGQLRVRQWPDAAGRRALEPRRQEAGRRARSSTSARLSSAAARSPRRRSRPTTAS